MGGGHVFVTRKIPCKEQGRKERPTEKEKNNDKDNPTRANVGPLRSKSVR